MEELGCHVWSRERTWRGSSCWGTLCCLGLKAVLSVTSSLMALLTLASLARSQVKPELKGSSYLVEFRQLRTE